MFEKRRKKERKTEKRKTDRHSAKERMGGKIVIRYLSLNKYYKNIILLLLKTVFALGYN